MTQTQIDTVGQARALQLANLQTNCAPLTSSRLSTMKAYIEWSCRGKGDKVSHYNMMDLIIMDVI